MPPPTLPPPVATPRHPVQTVGAIGRARAPRLRRAAGAEGLLGRRDQPRSVWAFTFVTDRFQPTKELAKVDGHGGTGREAVCADRYRGQGDERRFQ